MLLPLDIPPVAGEIRRAQDIGKKCGHKFIWHLCVKCGTGRWVRLVNQKPMNEHCYLCSNQNKGRYWDKKLNKGG